MVRVGSTPKLPIVYQLTNPTTMTRSLPRSTSLLFLAVVLSAPTSAQDFSPFNAESRKLFATPNHYTTFGITFDSTTVNGGTTTFHNYKTVWDTLTPSNCGWWGGQECNKQDRPTWAGPRMEVTTDGTHTLFNLWNEPITLAFSTAPGSQTLMYADGSQQFLLSYVGESPMEVLGLTENVRQWTILHEDLNGEPINSPLNNAPVDVGVTAGLIRYFRVDSFPLVLQPVELVGQSEPPLGLHTITPAFLHDYQPGDEVQVHDYANYYTGPPWWDENIYRKIMVLSRNDSPTEVTYEVETTVYNVDSATQTTGSASATYSKTNVIATIPFDRYDGTQPWLGMRDYCGIPLWTYSTYLNQGLGYCPEENCWGPYDTNGPPPYGGMTMVGGLGIFSSTSSITSPSGYTTSNTIIYFKKNGTECFQEVVMGTSGASDRPIAFQLSPNPSEGMITIACDGSFVGVDVLDAHGRGNAEFALDVQRGKLDMRAVANGLYLVRLRFVDGSIGTQRLLIAR